MELSKTKLRVLQVVLLLAITSHHAQAKTTSIKEGDDLKITCTFSMRTSYAKWYKTNSNGEKVLIGKVTATTQDKKAEIQPAWKDRTQITFSTLRRRTVLKVSRLRRKVDNGTYSCVASGAKEKKYNVVVIYGPDVTLTPSRLTHYIIEGQGLIITAKVESYPPVRDQRWLNPKGLKVGGTVLKLRGVRKSMAGKYNFTFYDSKSLAHSRIVTLVVKSAPKPVTLKPATLRPVTLKPVTLKPVTTRSPVSLVTAILSFRAKVTSLEEKIIDDTESELVCRVKQGIPAVRYVTWIQEVEDHVVYEEKARLTNGVSTLTIDTDNFYSNGVYSCVADNGAGVSDMSIDVYYEVIEELPDNQIDELVAAPNETVQFMTSFVAFGGRVKGYWTKTDGEDDVPVSNTAKATFQKTGTESILFHETSIPLTQYTANLIIPNVRLADTGEYVCHVVSSTGAETESTVYLDVIEPTTSSVIPVETTTGGTGKTDKLGASPVSMPVLVGVVCGVAAGAIIITVIVVVVLARIGKLPGCCRKKRKATENNAPDTILNNIHGSEGGKNIEGDTNSVYEELKNENVDDDRVYFDLNEYEDPTNQTYNDDNEYVEPNKQYSQLNTTIHDKNVRDDISKPSSKQPNKTTTNTAKFSQPQSQPIARGNTYKNLPSGTKSVTSQKSENANEPDYLEPGNLPNDYLELVDDNPPTVVPSAPPASTEYFVLEVNN